MKEIALYDAKNRLSALIQEVEQTGEDVIITRHGKPVARLAPVRSLSSTERAALFDELFHLRDNFTDAGQEPFDWKEYVEDGRE